MAEFSFLVELSFKWRRTFKQYTAAVLLFYSSSTPVNEPQVSSDYIQKSVKGKISCQSCTVTFSAFIQLLFLNLH